MSTGEEHTRAEAKPTSGGCGCSDPYAALPAELWPKRMVGNVRLRQTTCPTCGLVYWINRSSDICIACKAE